jgi:hypothetical protein
MLFDAKKYKFSKIVVDDLSTVLSYLKLINNTIDQLSQYQQYKYVAKLIRQFEESKEIIEIQLSSHTTIRNNKGAK